MSLAALKVLYMRAASAVFALCCRLRGMKMGRGCLLGGMPQLKLKRGSSLVLGNEVTLLSKHAYNTLIDRRCSLNLIKPGASIELGDFSGMSGAKIVCCTRVRIGEYTMIGANTTLYDCKQHDYKPEIGWRGIPELTGAPITIGKRCFIGMNCLILKGVTIGDNCVIAAGTTISEDVPAGHLAKGNPAKYYPLSERLRTLPDGTVLPLGEA